MYVIAIQFTSPAVGRQQCEVRKGKIEAPNTK